MRLTGLFRRLGRAAGYWARFGLATGTANLVRSRAGAGEIAMRIPDARSDVLARPGTSDLATFEQIFVHREYEFDLKDLQPRFIVDAGANVGYASIYFALRYPGARIVALEPDRGNFELLVRNVAKYPNIKPLNAALWHSAARVRIRNPDARSWAFQIERANQPDANDLDAVCMDDLISMSESGVVDLLKMDIEGAEKDVFGNGRAVWLPKVSAIVVELHDWLRPGCSNAFYEAIVASPFHQETRGENLYVRLRADAA